MKLHSRERDFRNDIVRVHSQRTVEHCFVFSVTPEDSVTDRNLLKRFSITRVKVNCALDGRFSQRQPRRSMVEAKKIKLVMSARELAVGLKKGGIARNGLVQQVDCLQQIRFQRTTQTQHKKIIGSIVEIKGYEISRGRLLNGQFLRSRNFRAKAPSDRSGKLTLERKQVVQIAIVFLCPDEIT